MKLKNLGHTFESEPYLTRPIDRHLVETLKLQDFDNASSYDELRQSLINTAENYYLEAKQEKLDNLEEFIQKAKEEYDYVIVDTAPTMLVTDTLLISKYADATLFVVRAGITDKKLLQFSKELAKNKKLNNMAYVLNAVGKIKKGNYNYGYAYGYNNTGA